MKRSILFFILMLLLTANIFAVEIKEINSVSVENKGAFPEDMQKIFDRGKLIVGIYCTDKPPFIMTNRQGKLYGIDIELARKIGQYLGVEVEFNREATTYNQLHKMVADGEVDVVISKFSRTFERAKNVRFTEPYLTFRQALIVNKLYAAKHKIEDYPISYLKNVDVKIGAREKTSYIEFAKEMFPKATIVEDIWARLIKRVITGDIVAVLRDEYEILKLIQKNPDMALYVSVYVLKDKKDCIAMAVPSKSLNLLAWLNMFIETNAIHKNVNDVISEYPEVFGVSKKQEQE